MKNTKEQIHRSFEIDCVVSNLPTHDWIRLLLTELQDRGISMSRATHIHPPNPRKGEELGPTKIVVVLQSFGVQEAALLFHDNERFAKYSWKEQGLRCREPRPTHQRSAGRMVNPPDWNMEDLWSGPQGLAQLEEREQIRRHQGLYAPNQSWGRLHWIPSDTALNDFSHF